MARVVSDVAVRAGLSDAGVRRTAALSWDDAARGYLGLYRELAAYSPSP